jgi:hypothetical protein
MNRYTETYLTLLYKFSEFIFFEVKLFVSKLTSVKTQIPFDYYSLPYCKPSLASRESENIGEVISGDRIENSVYKVRNLF